MQTFDSSDAGMSHLSITSSTMWHCPVAAKGCLSVPWFCRTHSTQLAQNTAFSYPVKFTIESIRLQISFKVMFQNNLEFELSRLYCT